MATQNDGPNLSLIASVAVVIGQLVKLTASLVNGVPSVALCAADATVDAIGVAVENQPTVNGRIAVRMLRGRTSKMLTNAAVTLGAIVYKDASGKIGTTNTNARIGIALQAASGAGSLIEVLAD
jgi:hypothetical protein